MLVVAFVFLSLALLPDGCMADEARDEPLHTNKITSRIPLMRAELKAESQHEKLMRSEGVVFASISPNSQACSWSQHNNRYSYGYAGGKRARFSVEDAKIKCSQMKNVCKAVTCNNPSDCSLRASSALRISRRETTYVPSADCFKARPDPELYDQETGCPIQIQDNILKRHSLHWKAPSDRPDKACECTSDDACHGSEYNVPQAAWELWKLEPSKVAVCYKPVNAIGNGHCRCESEKEETRACVGKGALLSTQDRRNKYMDMKGLPKGAKRCAKQSSFAKCRCGHGNHTIWYGAHGQWKSKPASKSGTRCSWKVFGWIRHSAGIRACYCVEGDNPAPTPAPMPKPQEPKPQELGAADKVAPASASRPRQSSPSPSSRRSTHSIFSKAHKLASKLR